MAMEKVALKATFSGLEELETKVVHSFRYENTYMYLHSKLVNLLGKKSVYSYLLPTATDN